MQTPGTVVVVGGGIAGLVVARDLARGGREVILLEASDHLGGTVSSHVVGGITLDAGAESFAVRGDTVAALARELGLSDDIVPPNPAAAWLYGASGVAKPLPATSILGIPGSPLASDVVDVLGKSAATRAWLRDELLPGFAARDASTVGELVGRRMGSAVLEELVTPIVTGVHSRSPLELDVDRVAPGLRAALRRYGSLARAVRSLRQGAPAGSAVAGIRGGVHRLVEELTAELQLFGVDVRLGARVTAIDDHRVSVGGDTYRGEVVVAAPRLLGETSDAARGVVLATLVVDAPRLDAAPRGTGVLVAKGAAGIRAKALTHATAKWAWLAERTGGAHVLRLSYAADAPTDLSEQAMRDAAALLGTELPPSTLLDFARVEWTRPAPAGANPTGITVVGEAVSGTGLASTIAHSRAQAARLLSA